MQYALTLVENGVGDDWGQMDALAVLSLQFTLETESDHVHVHILNALRQAS